MPDTIFMTPMGHRKPIIIHEPTLKGAEHAGLSLLLGIPAALFCLFILKFAFIAPIELCLGSESASGDAGVYGFFVAVALFFTVLILFNKKFKKEY